jgi:glycine cleavage system transcriptional repressor
MQPDHFLVLSAVGPDRPGLVSEVTSYLTERGGNIEDSRMAVLGAEFGVLLLVSGTPDEIRRIERDISALQQGTGLSFTSRPTKSPEEHRRGDVAPCLVVAEALNYEGIVRSVSTALHQVGVNIVSLETTAYNAPVTGSPLFRLEARVDVPRGVTVRKVREAMERVAEQENIDIEVRSPR